VYVDGAEFFIIVVVLYFSHTAAGRAEGGVSFNDEQRKLLDPGNRPDLSAYTDWRTFLCVFVHFLYV
jgi:hypothetical protein